VLGAGFVVGGYCPGTSVAATATGRIDGLVYVAGLVFGTLVFAEAFPLIKSFYVSSDYGRQTLPSVLGLRYGLVVFGVVLMAVAGFWGAGWVEKRFASPSPDTAEGR
jgi:hypothetical protein